MAAFVQARGLEARPWVCLKVTLQPECCADGEHQTVPAMACLMARLTSPCVCCCFLFAHVGTPPVVPFQEKLKVWQAYNLEQRAEEQKIKVQQDAAAFVAYYQEVQQQMDSGVTLHSDWLSSYASMEEVQAGLKALKLSGMGFVKSQLKQGSDLQHKIGAPLF